jgi:TusA-related sulfurtransferase
MPETIDCRGLACPEPVLLTRQALQERSSGTLTILVSTAVARDNVTRAARSMGWSVESAETADGFTLTVKK